MTPSRLLDQALLRDPARPLVTFYDDAGGERTELSVTTFANWVAKTANLLQDGLGAAPGDRVALHLPAHWQSAVWLAACWAAGLVAAPGSDEAQIAVVAYDDPGAPPVADEVVALGLGPLGLPRPGSSPPRHATVDYDSQIHGYGDRFAPAGQPDPAAPALELDGTALTAADLGREAEDAARRWAVPAGSRLLSTRPLADLDAVLAGLLVPLAGDTAVVLCRNLDELGLAERLAAEHVVAGLGLPASVRDLRRL